MGVSLAAYRWLPDATRPRRCAVGYTEPCPPGRAGPAPRGRPQLSMGLPTKPLSLLVAARENGRERDDGRMIPLPTVHTEVSMDGVRPQPMKIGGCAHHDAGCSPGGRGDLIRCRGIFRAALAAVAVLAVSRWRAACPPRATSGLSATSRPVHRVSGCVGCRRCVGCIGCVALRGAVSQRASLSRISPRRTAMPNVCPNGPGSHPRDAVCAGHNAGEGADSAALSRR